MHVTQHLNIWIGSISISASRFASRACVILITDLIRLSIQSVLSNDFIATKRPSLN